MCHFFQPSVLDRLGSSTGGKHIINLREESIAAVRSDSSSGAHNQGVARVVSSAITSAHRSVCVLPPSNSSGKKLEVSENKPMTEYHHISFSLLSVLLFIIKYGEQLWKSMGQHLTRSRRTAKNTLS